MAVKLEEHRAEIGNPRELTKHVKSKMLEGVGRVLMDVDKRLTREFYINSETMEAFFVWRLDSGLVMGFHMTNKKAKVRDKEALEMRMHPYIGVALEVLVDDLSKDGYVLQTDDDS